MENPDDASNIFVSLIIPVVCLACWWCLTQHVAHYVTILEKKELGLRLRKAELRTPTSLKSFVILGKLLNFSKLQLHDI